MNPLLKTPPGSWSKCSSSIARSMRALILVTLETSSSESSFFSRALRNLSPNSPTLPSGGAFRPNDDGNIIGQAGGARHRQEGYGEVTCGSVAKRFLRFLAERQCELGFAICGGIVESVGSAVAFGGLKEQAVLHAVGHAGEAGFAVGVGAHFQVELAGIHESIRNVDFDRCGVDRGA